VHETITVLRQDSDDGRNGTQVLRGVLLKCFGTLRRVDW